MAHFAQLDENNVVTQVIVVANEELLLDGVENETKGIMFCKSLLGDDTRWVQTSYNGNIRKNYAGIGYTYDSTRDIFLPPQPYPSWIMDAERFDWINPVPKPDSGRWLWNEEALAWEEYEIE